jgi:CHAT domain-containing protein
MVPGEDLPRPAPAPPRRAPPPHARLVYHVQGDRTVVLAVRPDGEVKGHVHPHGRTEIEQAIALLRRTMGIESARGVEVRDAGVAREVVRTSPGSDATALLRGLHRDLVAPVADALPEGEPLIIEPHGPLWLLPFAALQGNDGAWLGDRCPLQYSPSHDILRQIEIEPGAGAPRDLRALIVGDPVMPRVPLRGELELQLGPLPGAREEAREVAALLPNDCTLLLGADATLSRVEEEMHRHDILHFATHGIADADSPLDSFLALAAPPDPSLLTARMLLDRVLHRPVGEPPRRLDPEGPRGRETTDMVVLSACQTALGQITGDGVIGLTRAFLIAGARSVVVSLWSVDDDATLALMVDFYRRYLETGDKAVALQLAMKHARSRPEWAAPRFWAPFMLVGAAR